MIVPPDEGLTYTMVSEKSNVSSTRKSIYDLPKPNTFSGQRSLDFVLKNQGLIDKTLLFDIEVVKILD